MKFCAAYLAGYCNIFNPHSAAIKKSPHKCGQKYWKQCEQCRTEYLSCLLNYSVMRKIIFLI
ncbi:hypothetical protein SB6408_00196 [Klebsiella spallanzanii]|uniref:Uncharacterized protein n=1 Tax=Klebsiella spallanzanii TaxID=2587528 RepID=A0A564H7Y6_9ENTR|nr:hypothetical protein SB6408_00196 [Klebsiella spallanzanii]